MDPFHHGFWNVVWLSIGYTASAFHHGEASGYIACLVGIVIGVVINVMIEERL